MNKPYFCRIFFLIDWRHKRLKNTIDLFYGEHFYGFSESDSNFTRKLAKHGNSKVVISAANIHKRSKNWSLSKNIEKWSWKQLKIESSLSLA